MRDIVFGGPPSGPEAGRVAALVTDLAYLDVDDERVRAVAGACFKGEVPRPTQAAVRAALGVERAALAKRRKASEGAQARIDPVITVASAEPICRAHWFKRLSGVALGLTGIAMLVPMPFVVAAGIVESEAIEQVYADPTRGLLYGVAPVGGALAIHALKESFTSDRMRKVFDVVIYGSAVAAAAVWATLFGPTFLTDPLAGFGAAAESASSLSDWYTAHLALEFTAGAAAINAASDLLTRGSKLVSVPHPTRTALGEMVEADHAKDRSLAEEEDAIAAANVQYEDALAAFQDRCVVHVASARKLLAAKAAMETQIALAEVREAMLTALNIGETHA